MSLIVLVMAFALDRLTIDLVAPAVGASRTTAAQLDSLRTYVAPVDIGRTIPDSLLSVPATRPTQPIVIRSSTRPAVSQSRSSWRVSAILISEQQRIAVIDETIVRLGDTLPDGTRVAVIAPDYVDLVSPDGAHHVVRLSERGS